MAGGLAAQFRAASSPDALQLRFDLRRGHSATADPDRHRLGLSSLFTVVCMVGLHKLDPQRDPCGSIFLAIWRKAEDLTTGALIGLTAARKS